MTYRELLKLYKDGNLDEADRQQVEADLDKHAAISEYLFDEDSLPEFGLEDTVENATATSNTPGSDANGSAAGAVGAKKSSAAANDALTREIRKAIRRAFVKMGTVVGVIVLAVVLLAETVLPKVFNVFYYDPRKPAYSKAEQEAAAADEESVLADSSLFETEMAIFSELFLPLRRMDGAIIQSEGYGNYDFQLTTSIGTVGKTNPIYSGNIRKNKITFFDPVQVKVPWSNAFEWTGFSYRGDDLNHALTDLVGQPETRVYEDGTEVVERVAQGFGGAPEDAKEILEDLPADTEYYGYVTFNKIHSFEDAVKLMESHDYYDRDCWFCFMSDAGNVMGFYNMSWSSFVEMADYPKLFRVTEDYQAKATEDDAKQHVLSMLEYMQAHPDFCRMMETVAGAACDPESLEETIEYVEAQGLQICGVVVEGDKDALLKLLEDEEVYSVGVNA